VSKSVFVDTTGWLAAATPREARHAEFAAAYDDLTRRGVVLVTTNLVVAEMHALTVRERGPAAGCALLDAIHSDPAYRIITVTRELESDATDRWLRPFRDQRFSLTDAVSFEVMRVEGIVEVLTLDRHFVVAGYRLLPHAMQKPAPSQERRRRSGR
jgi:predicted nucleic acid-binding protein